MFRTVPSVVMPIPLASIAPTGEVIDAATGEAIIKVEDEGDVNVAPSGQFHSDQEDYMAVFRNPAPPPVKQQPPPGQVHSEQEDYMDILMNAVQRRKLQIKARRASGSANHPAPAPPVHQQPPPPPVPAQRAWTKRPATELPPRLSGVRQAPQKQQQKLHHHQVHQSPPPAPAPAHRAWTTGKPPGFSGICQPAQKQQYQVPQEPPRQRAPQQAPPLATSNAHHAPAATGKPPPVNSRSKPPLHPRHTAKPAAAAFKKPTVPCGVCGVRCMTVFHLKQHEKGRKHRNKVAYTAGEMNVRCEVCDVPLLSKLNVKEHYAGKQHVKQLFRSGTNGATGDGAT